MKIHLRKNYGNLEGVACTNNPFIKGRIVNLNEFKALDKTVRCKKCENFLKQ